MSLDEPAFLPVGTEVSAKYRGAFCEARVKKIVKTVKVKVSLKEGGSVIALDDDLRCGMVRLGSHVEVKHPEFGQYMEGTITKITDASMYTVVFDDGDENTLRRTQLCLKGEKHFVKTDTLDELPLTNPEHFGTPVMKGGRGARRRSPASALSDESATEDDSSDEEPSRRRYIGARLEAMVGRVVQMEQEDRKKTYWVPVLVCQPFADDSTDLKTREHMLVKSFKDSKFYAVSRKQTKEFSREFAMKNEDKALKNAYEKALLYIDAKELPQTWAKDELLGSDTEEDDAEESSDDEPSEEKDRFVAQLYKFMDDRGTPINKGPVVGARDLNLYRLFRVVQGLGGYNRVTNQIKWRLVYSKMGLPPSSAAANQIKTAYKKYLHAFEDFYRKLGSTMGTTSISRPMRAPRTPASGGGRSLMSFREREGTPRSPGRAKKAEDEEPSTPSSSKDEFEKSEMKTRSKGEDRRIESREESETESDSPRKRTRGGVEQEKKAKIEIETKRPGRPSSRDEGSRERKSNVKDEDSRGGKDDKAAGKEDETTSEKDDKEDGRPQRRRGRKKRLGEDEEEDEKLDEKPAVEKVERRGRPKLDKPKPEPPKSTDSSDNETEDESKSVEEERRSNPTRDGIVEYPTGSKLRVKYGKGKNMKVYDAKVVEAQCDGNIAQYKVHYAGWNNRYDEWVRRDRIVCCLDKAATPKGAPPTAVKAKKETKETKEPKMPVLQPKEKKVEKPAPKSAAAAGPAGKPAPVPKAPSSVSSTDSSRPSKRSRSPPPVTVAGGNKPRPTRSTSMESPLHQGLPVRRRRQRRRGSGMAESDIQSRDSSDESDDSAETEEKVVESEGDEAPTSPPSLQQEEPIAAPTPPPTTAHADEQAQDSKPADPEESKQSPPRVTKQSPPRVSKQSPMHQPEKKDVFEFEEEKSMGPVVASPPRIGSPGRSPFKGPVVEMEKVSDETVARVTKSPIVPKDKVSSLREKAASKLEKSKEKAAAAVSKVVEAVKEVDSSKDSDASDSEPRTPGKRRTARKRAHSETKVVEEVKKEEPTPVTPVKEEKEEEKEEEPKLASPMVTESQISKVDVTPAKVDTTKKAEIEEDVKSSAKKRAAKAGKALAEKAPQTPESDTKTKAKPKGKRKLDKSEEVEEKEEPKQEAATTTTTSEPLVKKARRKLKKKDDEEDSDSPVKEVKAAVVASAPVISSPPREKPAPPVPAPVVSKEPSRDDSMAEVLASLSAQPPAPPVLSTPLQPQAPLSLDIAPPVAEATPSVSAPPKLSPVPESSTEPNQPKPSPQKPQQEASNKQQQEPSLEAGPSDLPVTSAAPTPPDTPERSPAGSKQASPQQGSTKSEHEANMEVETLLAHAAPAGAESPSACDMSTVSVGSGGSSGNAPGSESECAGAGKQVPVEEEVPPMKRRRRGKRLAVGPELRAKRGQKNAAQSDSDDGEANTSQNSSPAKRGAPPTSTTDKLHPSRPCKYNFLDLGEGKYLEGDERIKFLVEKIKDLRTIYMQIKAEVACIDRRRKRARRREREGRSLARHTERDDAR